MTDRERLIEIVKNSLIKHIDKSCCLAENIVDDLLAENVTTLPVAFSDNRRERMIELLGGFYEETGLACVYYFTDEESEMLADYILADGWIRPPCKVGDELYCVYSPPRPANPADKGKWYMDKFEVARFHYGVKGLSIEMYGYGTVNANEIGKTVFIGDKAKEEAEKALAERSVNNG